MNKFRWLLILDEQSALVEPEQRYRLWLVELDEEAPGVPLRCDSLDDLYQAVFSRQQRSCQPKTPEE